jgi:hypothetical protein
MMIYVGRWKLTKLLCWLCLQADLAAKYVIREMSRSSKSSNGKAIINSASAYSEVLTTATLADWIEEYKGVRLNRSCTMEDLKQFFGKKLTPEVREMQTFFMEFLGALGRASDNLRLRIRNDSSVRTMVDKTLYYSSKVPPSALLKAYISEHTEVLLMPQDLFIDEDEATHTDDTTAPSMSSNPISGQSSPQPGVSPLAMEQGTVIQEAATVLVGGEQ